MKQIFNCFRQLICATYVPKFSVFLWVSVHLSSETRYQKVTKMMMMMMRKELLCLVPPGYQEVHPSKWSHLYLPQFGVIVPYLLFWRSSTVTEILNKIIIYSDWRQSILTVWCLYLHPWQSKLSIWPWPTLPWFTGLNLPRRRRRKRRGERRSTKKS